MPEPRSSGWGTIALRKLRCRLGRQRLGDVVLSVPRVTYAQRKTGCANRNLGLGPSWLGARWAADVAEKRLQAGKVTQPYRGL